MLASLPMYDWPEVRAATDALWAAIAREIGARGPLRRQADHAVLWRDPGLLFSQTCGYPFTHEFLGKLALVATPHYACEGCEGANYASIVLAREPGPPDAFRGTRAAFNAPDSMSGMLALKLVFAPHAVHGRFFGGALETGSHIASMQAVREGKADVCAIDAVCVALARRYRPELAAGLVEIARSPPVPGLPYVTARDRDPATLRAALTKVFAEPALAEQREALYLAGLSFLPTSAYVRILDLETGMERQGGLNLESPV
jgi:ABC-type phosphate/phosphonate transport system substrate-binding protein